MTSLTMPLLVFEGNDLSFYETVKDACGDLEAVDVRNGIFDSFDRDGFRVELLTSGYAVVDAKRVDDQAPVPQELAARLRAYLSAVGDAAGEDPSAEVTDLVGAAALCAR